MVGLFVGQCRVELQNELADRVLVCGMSFSVPAGHSYPKISRVPPSGVNYAQDRIIVEKFLRYCGLVVRPLDLKSGGADYSEGH